MRQVFLLYLKGVAMGLADLVPGVSGGTIALITGIYNKLIHLISQIDLRFFTHLLRLRLSLLQKQYEILFFVVLGAGILTGVWFGSGAIVYLLENYRPVVFAFFIGMIIATSLKLIRKEYLKNIMLWLGIIAASIITLAINLDLAASPLNLFIGGAIAISAMLLPGLSGSFMLLILGIYEDLIEAVAQADLAILLPFIAGMLFTIFAFSRLISYCLNRYYQATMSFIIGLMLGSLIKLWPWQLAGEITSIAQYSNTNQAFLLESGLAFCAGKILILLLYSKSAA